MSVGYYLCVRCGEMHPLTSSAVCPNQLSQMVVRADSVTRTDLSQASVVAALERAVAKADYYAEQDYCALGYPEECGIAASRTADMIRRDIRALITQRDHDALAAHVAAEVAKALAEEFNRGVRAGCYAALAHLDRHDYREDVTRSGLQDEILAAQIGAKP